MPADTRPHRRCSLTLCALVAAGASFAPCAAAWPKSRAAQPAAAADQGSIVADSPAINSAWRTWREALNARAATLDPRDLAARAQAMKTWLAALDSRIPRPVAAAGRLHAPAMTQREQALARVLARVQPQAPVLDDPVLETEIDSAVTRLGGWYARAVALEADLARIEAALDAGQTLNEGGAAGSLRALTEKWTRDGLLRDPATAAAAAPVLDRVQQLERIAKEPDSAALVEIARSSPADRPEQIFAAWRRLGERPASPWPADAADLQAEIALRTPLLQAAARVPDAARARALADEVRAAQTQRIVRVLNSSADDATLRAAAAAMPALEVSPASLDGRVRFNLLLLELKDGLGAADDAAARERIGAFINAASGLPGGIAFLSGALPTMEALQAILDGQGAGAAAADPIRSGPAAHGLEAVEEGALAAFTIPALPGAPGARLEFVLIGQGAQQTYITTHEVTVGQFASIVAFRNAQRTLVQVQPHFKPLDDTRPGPRSWVWGADEFGLPVVQPAPSWLSPTAILAGVDFPTGQAPAKPAADSPMQHLRPAAAVLVANLIDCRLPTVDEWRMLATRYSPDIRPGETNLRDQRWSAYRDHMAKRAAAGRWTESPSAGSFTPAGFSLDNAAGDPVAWDDGYLFFAPGAADEGVVHHVWGNVAELVTLEPWPVLANSGPIVAQVAKNAQDLRVIGGSALAHRDLDPRTPWELDVVDALDGFSDVGFRLAFSPAEVRVHRSGVAASALHLLTPTPFLRPR